MIFQVLKESSKTGNGDTLDGPLELKVQESRELYSLLNEIENRVNSIGSAITPVVVRDESGVVFKRPSTSGECVEPSPKKQALFCPKVNFRKICDLQTETLDSILNEQMKTNELLMEIRDGLMTLACAVESLHEKTS